MSKLAPFILLCSLIAGTQLSYADTPAQSEQIIAAPPAACQGQSTSSWPGLTLSNGYVTGASILGEIEGYAKTAGTVGGLGGQLAVVTSNADYNPTVHQAAIKGSLRYILQKANASSTPIWVVFSPALGRPAIITLTSPIHVGNNTTIDGTCSDITISGVPRIELFDIENTHNIVIDRLRFTKTNYVAGVLNANIGTALRLRDAFDAIAVLHNDLSECGDGCIDSTSAFGDPVPTLARVTIAFNYIHDHDKAMLLGSINCANKDNCTLAEATRNAQLGPAFFMTMDGNALIRTGQRNPRDFGRAMLHSFSNYIAFEPYPEPANVFSGTYGIFVVNGARALIEHDCFVPLNPAKRAAVYTAGTPGTPPVAGTFPAFIRLNGGPQAPANAIIVQSSPQIVLNPPYIYHYVALDTLSPFQALACVASRAGRNGAASWSPHLCGATGG